MVPINVKKKTPPPVPPKPPNLLTKLEEIKSKLSENTSPLNPTPVNFREEVKYIMSDEEALKRLKCISTEGDPTKIYKLKEVLGSGYWLKKNKFLKVFILGLFKFRASGTVYRAFNKSNNYEFAIKRMVLEQINRKDLIVSIHITYI